MNQLIKTGRIMYAIGMIALGVVCFISKDFIIGRPPAWPENIAINPALGYATGAVIIIAAIAILLEKKGALAASLIAVLVLLLSVFRHLAHFLNDWPNAYKAMALFGGSLIVAASFLKNKGVIAATSNNNKNLVNKLIIAGCIFLAAFFMASGYAHFKFAAFVKDFIPAYIPFHIFLTYFTAVCLLGGGVGLLINFTRQCAALLSGMMITGWFILLHIPRFIANTADVSDRLGLCESFTFAGTFFVLAGMLYSKKKRA